MTVYPQQQNLSRKPPSVHEPVNQHLMTISDDEFGGMRQLIYDRFGINLTDQKKSLLVGRLQKLLRTSGYQCFADYYQHLLADKSERALSDLVDRISTNHTYFNRENDHFDYFRQTALPAVIKRLEQEGRRDLRIWCAGCSSGEEAYTLLMLMHEVLGSAYSKWNAGILATDISDRVLSIAREGCYPEERVSNLPEDLRRKYFRKTPGGDWQVNANLKSEATYRRFNLMNDRFPFKQSFQIIFCRNVMIYFDQETRDTLVSKFHRHTEADGYLFIGHSETLGRNHAEYQYLQPAVYLREGA